jgi:L-fuconolactonase
MGWLSQRPSSWDAVRRDFTFAELCDALDVSGVSDLILVQACTTPTETRELLALADVEARIRGVVGWASLRSPQATERDLASFDVPGAHKLVGIRNNHGWEPDGDILARPGVRDSCRLLAQAGLPLDLHVRDYADLPLALALVDAVPEGRYVVDHLGKPDLTNPDAFAPWAASMAALASHPHVYVKYSGWATFVHRTVARDVAPYVHCVLESFGARRVMYGSNWPVALVAGTYQDTYRATLEGVEDLPADDLADVLVGTAERCYLQAREPDQDQASTRPAPCDS